MRIVNDALRLELEAGPAGPEVVIEATYGWYWAVDVLEAGGAGVHLAHPLGVKRFGIGGSRTTSVTPPNWPTCCGWAACPRRGSRPRQPGSCASWSGTGPSWSRSAPIARLRSMPCWPSAGVLIRVDLFGRGRHRLAKVPLAAPYAERIASLLGLIESPDHESSVLRPGPRPARPRPRLCRDAEVPGIGPVLGAVLVAEIGDVTRFARPDQLCSWAGLTPSHHESDTVVHRGRITKQGSNLVRWAAIEAVQRHPTTAAVGRQGPDRGPPRQEHRQGRRGPEAAHAGLLRAARRPRPRAGPPQGGVSAPDALVRGRACLTPDWRGRPPD